MPKAVARPLVRLLSDVLLAQTKDYEDAGAGDDPLPSLVMWSGLLRAVTPAGIAVRDLVSDVRLSKRAVVSWTGVARRWGYVGTGSSSGPPKLGERVRLTDKGRAAHDEWPDVRATAERAWRKRVGAAADKELRTALCDLVSQFGLELPHYPVGYGSADWSLTGGRSRPAKPGPPRVPHHGADWSPVFRAGGDTVSQLPLAALVSQALTWMQIDCESVGAYPQIVEDVLRRIPERGVPLKEQPPLAHLSGDGRSGFERHGVLEVTAKGAEKRVFRTPLAERLLASYEPGMAEIESGWRDEYGTAVVGRVRSALEATATRLNPRPDPDHHLWVQWEGGFGFVEPTQKKRP